MNRWQIYELFKYPEMITDKSIIEIEYMDLEELREGVIEYLLMLKKEENNNEYKRIENIG